jgi:hypothetical protein
VSKQCGCKEWGPNIKLVEAPRMLLDARNPGSAHYEGVLWRYCPWCGNELYENDLRGVRGPAQP